MRDVALAQAYRRQGFGLAGVLLKQSLYPGDALRRLLDGAALVLDFGCGEGLLTNLLARDLPRTRFVGVDLDVRKIAIARKCRTNERVEFRAGSFFNHSFSGASAVIFNDVLHHLSPDQQMAALRLAAKCLDDRGIIILKEVDPADRLDVRHTTFWDSRLYPADTLRFSAPEVWTDRLQSLGFRHLATTKVRHPWIASRTLLAFTRRPKLAEFAPALQAASSPPTRSVLITGGTGFIGQWVTRQLLADGWNGEPVRIELLTRQPNAVPADLAADARVQILRGDLTDPSFAADLSGQWDAVFHLAATVDYFGGARVYAKNLAGTTHLLAALARLNVERLIYASTMGALDRGRWDWCERPLDESSPAHPTSPYGRAKLEEESLVRRSALDWTIVRIPWCYGPGMAESHHVRNLLGRVRRGGALTRVRWPGRVSIVEVREAARQFVAAATTRPTHRETFFLAEDKPVSFGDLFVALGRVAGRPAAGALDLPRCCWASLRPLFPLLPFQLKCLVTDALVVSTAHARRLGVVVKPRGADFLQDLARYDSNQRAPCRHRSTVLITGAAGGIGAALARLYHANGYRLVLADRNGDALRERCRELGASSWEVDLASSSLPQLLADHFPARFPWPAIVVNNAGLGWRGPAWSCLPQEFERVIAVNATAPATIASFFLRQTSAPLALVNLTSTAALQPLPFMAAYAAAKSFALSYSLALAAEARAHPSRPLIVTVVPAGTQTGFQAAAGVKTNPKEKLLSPDQVAAAVVTGVGRRQELLFVGSRGRFMRVFAAFTPLRWQGRIWGKMMSKLR